MDQLIEDAPPFAISETIRPLHLFDEKRIAQSLSSSSRFSAYADNTNNLKCAAVGKVDLTASHASSSPPGLAESVMTEGSASTADINGVHEQGYDSYHMGVSSNFLLSSLPTISSAIGSSSCFPSSSLAFTYKGQMSTELAHPVDRLEPSGTFSQLMRAADDDEDAPLRHPRMPVVPEDDSMEDSCAPSGALISAAASSGRSNRRESSNAWLPNMLQRGPRTGLEAPLLDASIASDEPIFAASPSEANLERARRSVQSFAEDDQTFEVSMDVPGPCTMQDLMNIIGNAELLRMWCDPIHSLVVTSASDRSGGDSGVQRDIRREYEAEWIEATTTALESPPCNLGYIYSAGEAICGALGFTSYGRVTMFVERRRGQIGLTIGPFTGGVRANHTMSFEDHGGRIRIIDRVRLSRDPEGASVSNLLFGCLLDSCFLSAFLVPSIHSYMEQVSRSMARLWILVESGELSPKVEPPSTP